MIPPSLNLLAKILPLLMKVGFLKDLKKQGQSENVSYDSIYPNGSNRPEYADCPKCINCAIPHLHPLSSP